MHEMALSSMRVSAMPMVTITRVNVCAMVRVGMPKVVVMLVSVSVRVSLVRMIMPGVRVRVHGMLMCVTVVLYVVMSVVVTTMRVSCVPMRAAVIKGKNSNYPLIS